MPAKLQVYYHGATAVSEPVTVTVMPDSGASCCIVKASALDRAGVSRSAYLHTDPAISSMRLATDDHSPVLGTALVYLDLEPGLAVPVKAVVVENLFVDALLGLDAIYSTQRLLEWAERHCAAAARAAGRTPAPPL